MRHVNPPFISTHQGTWYTKIYLWDHPYTYMYDTTFNGVYLLCKDETAEYNWSCTTKWQGTDYGGLRRTGNDLVETGTFFGNIPKLWQLNWTSLGSVTSQCQLLIMENEHSWWTGTGLAKKKYLKVGIKSNRKQGKNLFKGKSTDPPSPDISNLCIISKTGLPSRCDLFGVWR